MGRIRFGRGALREEDGEDSFEGQRELELTALQTHRGT